MAGSEFSDGIGYVPVLASQSPAPANIVVTASGAFKQYSLVKIAADGKATPVSALTDTGSFRLGVAAFEATAANQKVSVYIEGNFNAAAIASSITPKPTAMQLNGLAQALTASSGIVFSDTQTATVTPA